MFNYQVYSEQEAMAERFQLLKEGKYDAVIKASIDKVSVNSGNPMMDMTVSVFDASGKQHDIRDFLVFTPAMMWKVVHFAGSANLLKEYEDGKLCSEIVVNKRVKVQITVEEGREIAQDKLKGKALGSRYPDKNKIADYLKVDGISESQDDPFDDDIAF
jgi:hypothetical protein